MLITAGGMRIDYLISKDGQSHPGLAGGNALYSAVGASLWIENVGIWARIGKNFPVGWLSELNEKGISLRGIVRIDEQADHRTFFAYTLDGQRIDTDPVQHFSRIGQPMPEALHGYLHSTPGQDNPDQYEPLALRPDDWSSELDGAEAVHLAQQSLRSHLKLPEHLRQRRVRVITLDPGERYMVPELIPFIQEFLPQIDAFLPSYFELRSLVGPDIELGPAAKMLAQWGVPIVVVKCGAKGVFLYDRNDDLEIWLRPFHKPDDPKVIDVTGAGDAFGGGFITGLTQGLDAVQSAKRGIVSASLVIEGYGATYALNQPKMNVHERLIAIQKQGLREKRAL